MEPTFRTATLSKQMCMIGHPVFKEVPFMDLQVGDDIIQLGRLAPSGIETSSHRVRDFDPPVRYVGLIDHTDVNDNPATLIAFLIPAAAVEGTWADGEPQPVYMVYVLSDDLSEFYNSYTVDAGSNIQIFKSSFKKAPKPEIKFRFNSAGICINPVTVELYNKNKCSVAFEFAKVGNGWVYGTKLFMNLKTTDAYGYQGHGAWNGGTPMRITDCHIKATKEALQFFQEKGRIQHCTGVIKALNEYLHKLKN